MASKSNNLLVIQFLKNKAIKKSVFDARVYFSRYDVNSLKKEHFCHRVKGFDWENGKYVDFVWNKYKDDQFIIRIVRDRYNKLHIFDISKPLQRVFINFIVFYNEILYFFKNLKKS